MDGRCRFDPCHGLHNLKVYTMRISIDFDDTYTKDYLLWNKVISSMLVFGHDVICVSARHEYEMEKVHLSIGKLIGKDKCFGTGRVYKKKFMKDQGINIDVWIDDNPHAIVDPNWMTLNYD
jgi:hypothetical protein